MLTKSYSLIHTFARQKEDAQPRELSRQQRIVCDRIVIMTLFLAVIVAALVFS